MGFFADEDGDFTDAFFAVEVDADFHAHLAAEFEKAGDDVGEIGGDVLEVDQHIHDEEAADDALLDVLDVDAAFGDVGRELRDDAFLILAQNANDSQDGMRHGNLLKNADSLSANHFDGTLRERIRRFSMAWGFLGSISRTRLNITVAMPLRSRRA